MLPELEVVLSCKLIDAFVGEGRIVVFFHIQMKMKRAEIDEKNRSRNEAHEEIKTRVEKNIIEDTEITEMTIFIDRDVNLESCSAE